MIGTAIEWYDFFIYASAAGLVFNKLFFAPAGEQFATLIAFASVGVSFLFRPLGAFLAGHYGDRLGRRAMLVLTLVLMGASTALIGLLPTYDSAGLLAPLALILLRVLQGISAGGEWGGAVLMAVEHAPPGQRGRYGAFPQIGVPLGLLLASGVFALMSGVVSPATPSWNGAGACPSCSAWCCCSSVNGCAARWRKARYSRKSRRARPVRAPRCWTCSAITRRWCCWPRWCSPAIAPSVT